MTTPALFRPLTLRGTTFPNRIWLAPMCQFSVVDEDGVPGDWHLVHYASRAVGGFGLLLAEATAVVPDGRITPRDTGLWGEKHVAGWARVLEVLHSVGALVGVQLAHAGRKGSSYWGWAGHSGTVPVAAGGWRTVAPSPLGFPGFDDPDELSTGEIAELVRAFGAAAGRADEAGFDVVEVHAAHGYLLHQFLSPLSNRRTDAYGGSLANRARILLETVDAVRETWPADKPALVRFSASDWLAGGLDVDAVAEVASWAGERGIDLVDVSTGGLLPAPVPASASFQVPYARTVRERTGLPVSAVGLITRPAQAEQIITEESADVVMVAREALRDPMWPRRAAHVLGASRDAVPWPPQYLRGAWG
jgi:2,4-dienoyl-CoA reductase-like NADH-dependent reductase (Old Yellow Enzyme family)